MPKKSVLKLESVQVFLPEELPFEKGTGLSRLDACSRLTFQLLIERVLPGYALEKGLEGEDLALDANAIDGVDIP